MKNSIFTTVMMLTVGLSACNNNVGEPGATAVKSDTMNTQKAVTMNNLVTIVEIPATDLARAVKFYEGVLAVKIDIMDMDGVQLGVIPNDEGSVNVVLAKGDDYKPTTNGPVLYLNAGEDLQPMLDRIKQNGGEVTVAKTLISPEMGYFAMFTDSEGNKLGLHSSK